MSEEEDRSCSVCGKKEEWYFFAIDHKWYCSLECFFKKGD